MDDLTQGLMGWHRTKAAAVKMMTWFSQPLSNFRFCWSKTKIALTSLNENISYSKGQRSKTKTLLVIIHSFTQEKGLVTLFPTTWVVEVCNQPTKTHCLHVISAGSFRQGRLRPLFARRGQYERQSVPVSCGFYPLLIMCTMKADEINELHPQQ